MMLANHRCSGQEAAAQPQTTQGRPTADLRGDNKITCAPLCAAPHVSCKHKSFIVENIRLRDVDRSRQQI
jgi:hypothetical protein